MALKLMPFGGLYVPGSQGFQGGGGPSSPVCFCLKAEVTGGVSAKTRLVPTVLQASNQGAPLAASI